MPKGLGRKPASGSNAGFSGASGSSVNDKVTSSRPKDIYDSDEEELKDDPLYAPPSKSDPLSIKYLDLTVLEHFY